MMKFFLLTSACCLLIGAAFATPVTYIVDPNHTYPSFEADHLGGLSIWRGKFTKSEGVITLDRERTTGSVDITVDAASIDFGNPKLNDDVRGPEMFDVAKFSKLTYRGRLTKFQGGVPTQVEGELTLHGVTKPLTLKIQQFMCKPSPMVKKEVCGADAAGRIDRASFGIDYGAKYGFKQDVKLQIQVEAVRAEPKA